MSDLPNVEPPAEDRPDTNPGVGPAVEPAAKSRAKKPLRRRILKWVLIVVGVSVLFRLALPFILPIVIDQVAGSYNLSVEYEELNLSLLGGEVELRDLVVTPIEGGDEFARLGYLRIDVRMWRLLGGSFHIKRADVDGIDV